MNLERVAAWIPLLNSGVPHAALLRLVEYFGSAEEAANASQRALREAGVTAQHAERLAAAREDAAHVERQLEVFQLTRMRLVEWTDAEYPPGLKRLADPPPALFVRGDLTADDELAIALVGSRNATAYGREVARRLARELAPMLTVVSGLAVGIDSVAHEAALEAGGRTIGVSAASLDQDYPKTNARLRQRIPEAGALVSIHPPLTPAAPYAFPHRNYLLAGMVLGVIVVEAAESSGSLSTARAALDENREVLAVPGDITRANSAGPNQLIALGAAVCRGADDVIAALEPVIDAALRKRLLARRGQALRDVEEKLAPEEQQQLPPAEALLLAAIRHEPAAFDDLAARFVPDGMDVGTLTAALLSLELRGRIRQLPGRLYYPAG